MRPLVSIIVPCFKQAEFLEQSLSSVLNQTFTDWECIIINDGSPDNTGEIAKKWVLRDERFKYISQKHQGLSASRNMGISMALGKYILPLDADDKISPLYISLAVDAFADDPALKLVYCKAERFGDQNGPLNLKPFSLKELCENNMIFCSAIYKKRDWEKVDGYDSNMKFGWEDWEFWIAILKSGGKVLMLEEVGFFYRIKVNSMLMKMKPSQKKVLYEYMSIKHPEFFVKQLGSFFELRGNVLEIEKGYRLKLRSEKFVIDLFLKTFFGFTLFGKYKE